MNEVYNTMEYFEDVEGVTQVTYYHYTSLDALYNIVKNKRVRLTSLKSSNDKEELYYNPKGFLIDFSNLRVKEKNANIKGSSP